MNREYNDNLVSVYTLLEEYKHLMTSTPCGAMKNFFQAKFFDNLRKLEVLLDQQKVDNTRSGMQASGACRIPHCTKGATRELTIEELLKYNGIDECALHGCK